MIVIMISKSKYYNCDFVIEHADKKGKFISREDVSVRACPWQSILNRTKRFR